MSGENNSAHALTVVVTGPSGAGKSTVISRIMSQSTDFVRSKSATTRKKRVGDPNENKYTFISKEQFKKFVKEGKIIEYSVYLGEYYGTLAYQIEETLDAGKNIIFDIDVRGALAIKKLYPETIVICLLPESFEDLFLRLRTRNTENDQKIFKRIQKACDDFKYFESFDYLVLNKTSQIDRAASDILSIVRAEKLKISRNMNFYCRFLKK